MSHSRFRVGTAVLVMQVAITAVSGCGSKRPTDPDTLPPFIQWLSPGVSPAVLEFPTDTVTVEFAAADDGGVISQVIVFFQGAPVATLTTSPFRHTLNLSGLGHNRPGRVYATATDPTGKVGSTADTLQFMLRPQDTVAWTQLAPARQPAPRVGHTLSLDAASQRAILFGGESFQTFEATNDTWIFDLTSDSWDSLAVPSPPPVRKDHAAGVVWGTLVIFGGELLLGGADSVLQDYALLDLATSAWATNLYSPFLPPQRSMCMAAVGSRLYTYGGSSTVIGTANDSTVRVFDLLDTSWAATGSYVSAPRQRVDAVMSADLESGRLILYGGASGPVALPTNASNFRFTMLSETWASEPQRVGDPPPVTRAAAVCDSLNNRVLMWGGVDSAGNLVADVWEYSLGNLRWRKLVTAGSTPAGRAEHEMVMDPARSRAIMFGGRVGGIGVDETWELRW